MWLTDMFYDLFPICFYSGLLLVTAYFTIEKKGKVVLTCILLLLLSFVYIDQYPTKYPFEDDWIIGKTREEILERYEDQRLIFDEEDWITYRCRGYFSYGGKNWWAHEEQGVDIDYEYTIFFDESGKAAYIEYRGYG